MDSFALDFVELPPGEKGTISLQLPAEFIIVFEPVTHCVQFHRRQGRADPRAAERCRWSSTASICRTRPWRCGPDRCALRWRTAPTPACCRRSSSPATRCTICCGKRRPFLTAKRLLTNQTFRDLYRTDTLDVDQRLKITSLTFLFTDLRGFDRALRAGRRSRRLRHRARAFPGAERDRRGRGRRRGQDHRRRGDGDLPDARPGDRRGARMREAMNDAQRARAGARI